MAALEDVDDEAIALAMQYIWEELFNEAGPGKLDIGVDTHTWRVLDGDIFEGNFRMPKLTFQRLVVAVGEELIRTGVSVHLNRTPLDVSVMMALWVLSTMDTFRSTAIKFGVSIGVVFFHYARTITALTSLAGRYIKWPNACERMQIAHAFEQQTEYIGCVGAIDGVHLYVTAPTNQAQRYVNRHHSYSISAQAVCDHHKLYRDIYVGEPGSVGDIQMFRRSPLSQNLYSDPHMLSEGEHLVGDQVYPLTDKIQIPFPRVNADERQRNHNYILSKCRSIVERSFALLKEKFQRLRRLRSYCLDIAIRHIVSCFVLHNFIILEGFPMGGDDEDNIQDEVQPADEVVMREYQYRGAVKREYVTLMLWRNRAHG